MDMMNSSADPAIYPGGMFDGMSSLPSDTAVTMAYVPFQTRKNTYDDDDALCAGTLFKDLNKPFLRGAIQ